MLETVLRELEADLRRVAPGYLASLPPGVHREESRSFLVSIGVSEPAEELTEWWAWRNGSMSLTYFFGLRLLSLAEAADALLMVQCLQEELAHLALGGSLLPAGWVPIIEFGGNFLWFDTGPWATRGHIWEWGMHSAEPAVHVSSSLGRFIGTLRIHLVADGSESPDRSVVGIDLPEVVLWGDDSL